MVSKRVEENERIINAATPAELEAIEKDLLECNMLLEQYQEIENEEYLDRIYEIVGEMLARGFKF